MFASIYSFTKNVPLCMAYHPYHFVGEVLLHPVYEIWQLKTNYFIIHFQPLRCWRGRWGIFILTRQLVWPWQFLEADHVSELCHFCFHCIHRLEPGSFERSHMMFHHWNVVFHQITLHRQCIVGWPIVQIKDPRGIFLKSGLLCCTWSRKVFKIFFYNKPDWQSDLQAPN